ncbi:MAG: succinylglutamate desuccinylase/aspartoacylase family protein [Dyadobacter sp.]|uniref:M14 family zinc carboxypeptidase n=1 Tax=Dyadobacter sp. TaxID=1914288 RepID=UPI001B1A8D7D|nr:M14 family zinc carboxypeptidase [Dyadobacter sp.]MBO9617079.1 succinylglutamate desuccinylase/aspartoacylase family protein [Dyadobacter sp.]
MKFPIFSTILVGLLITGAGVCTGLRAQSSGDKADSIAASRIFIHTGFENASPMNWRIDSAGRVVGSLVYDRERFSRNRAVNHFHFRVEAATGTEVTVILENFDNIWNNRFASDLSERSRFVLSFDQKKWESRPIEVLPGGGAPSGGGPSRGGAQGRRMLFKFRMEAPFAYIASVEPYRISDLDMMLARIGKNKLAAVTTIGKTSEGRSLEIIRIGSENAPKRLFLRARAHAFEAGGNWTVEGLVQKLLSNDADAQRYLKRYCVYILPMANKDGVARGKTRFNANGYDLNRKWDKPADERIAPENYYLEQWLQQMIKANKKPDLALDIHNDAGGNLHISRPDGDITSYLASMDKLESLLRKHTWFTEGATKASFKNPGTLGEGFLTRFGIYAAVYELNYEWIKGLNKAPLAADWISLGNKLPEVFYHYFE